MKKISVGLSVLAGLTIGLSSCNDDDNESVAQSNNIVQEGETSVATTKFNVTIRNTVNFLNTIVFNTPYGETSPGPNPEVGGKYKVTFKAVPGTKLSFATMNAKSNDWFYAPVESGIELFNEAKEPITGDVTGKVYLWDSGTEEEDMATQAAVNPNTGAPDDDTNVRAVKISVVEDMKAELAYDSTSKEFTLTLTNLLGGENGIVLTPGLVVLHAQEAPLFRRGTADLGYGLKEIAEDGNPSVLYDWFKKEGTNAGALLRMSASLAKFSPALVYAFDGSNEAKDPFFTQGEAAKTNSGLEELAEDGDRKVAYNYIKNELGIPVAKSNETEPIGPGEEFTFTLEVPTNNNYKFTMLSMFVPSNDWFISHNTAGLDLFDGDGNPMTYTNAGTKLYLYDAGTEIDEPVGAGEYQVVSQSGPNSGPADSNTAIRRVASLEDGQFGKGIVSGGSPGVVWKNDSRGGYNLIEIDIVPEQ